MECRVLTVLIRSAPFPLSSERQVAMPGRRRALHIHLDDQTCLTLQHWMLPNFTKSPRLKNWFVSV